MGIFDRLKLHRGVPSPASSTTDPEKKPQLLEIGAKQIFRPRIIAMAIIVSMGGFIFGAVAVIGARDIVLT
jgi:SP family sugar:H+ symporter-like MFS transporter